MAETKLKAVAENNTRSPIITNKPGFTIRHLRWWIIGLVFLATLINYIDRLTISVLAPVIREDLRLSNLEYAGIGTWFLFAYTISQGLSGKLYDRIGTRRGFSISIIVWSIAAMGHALARGLTSLSLFRSLLGLGEAGNWPGAAKAVAEWFPVRERAFAMAIFNSGAALGSVIAPPLIVWIQLRYGWQATFMITGALGFIWLAVWLLVYRTPQEHAWLSREERDLIAEGQQAGEPTIEGQTQKAVQGEGAIDPVIPSSLHPLTPAPTKWRALLKRRQVWAIVLSRLLVDPVWWLYIFWLPEYLNKARGFSLKEIGLFAWVPYLAADAGSLLGGFASGYLMKRGWSVDRARKSVIAFAACLMPAGIFAARADNPMVALALIGVVLFGFQVWINNVQTLPGDFFPNHEVASVAGLGGTGAGIGSAVFTLTTGFVVDHFSYTPVLTAAGLLAPLGTVILFALAGPIKKVRNEI